jgi:hypothetical protein
LRQCSKYAGCAEVRSLPLETGGYKTASCNEAKVRDWWARYPDANAAIAPGASGLTVLDVDHGIRDEAHLREWLAVHEIAETLAVRTGRRPEFAVQLYYSGPIPSVGVIAKNPLPKKLTKSGFFKS